MRKLLREFPVQREHNLNEKKKKRGKGDKGIKKFSALIVIFPLRQGLDSIVLHASVSMIISDFRLEE